MRRRDPAATVLASVVTLAAGAAHGGLYWGHDVRGETISLCFVGDAVTARPDRVDEILDYLREFERHANVRFNYLGSCPASVVQANGNDSYAGDIRVVLSNTSGTTVTSWTGAGGTGPVPGNGCPMFRDGNGKYCDSSCNPDSNNDGWGSWSNAPDDLAKNRACLYNLKLGDDPWNATPYLNHTLHEFGHALGLGHEHQRNDVDKGCTAKGYGGGASGGHMTPYDRRSVMHYKFATCGINGNYDHTGLSAHDKVALRILYPEDNRVAEYVGSTLIRAGRKANLRSGWQARGANLDFVASGFQWTVGTSSISGPTLDLALPVGKHPFQYRYKDFLGRDYTAKGTITVLPAVEYDRLLGATRAAQLPLF